MLQLTTQHTPRSSRCSNTTRRGRLAGNTAAAHEATQPFVSVIIPVYNDTSTLVTCLHALRRQTYPKERFDITVIDNGSSHDTTKIIREFPEVRFELEEKPGSYAARNKGLSVVRGEIIAFTDSDCIPQPEWIEKGVEHLRSVDNCGLVGGAIEFVYQSETGKTIYELYDSMFYFDQQDYITRGHFACTANAFTYSHVVSKVGRFDATLKSVGDREWGNRIAGAGYRQTFAGDCVVRHPARNSMNALLTKRLRLAGGHHDFARRKRLVILRFFNALRRHLIRDPFVAAVALLRSARRIGLRRAAQVLGIYTFLSYAEAYERMRLLVGGESRR